MDYRENGTCGSKYLDGYYMVCLDMMKDLGMSRQM